jgi:lipoprotein-anchoring transpeptidase ErfK/SrfK
VPWRPLITAAAGLAVASPLALAEGLSPGAVEAARTAEASAAAAIDPAAAYTRARERGQPIAILRRRTVLRASPAGRPLVKLRRKTEWGTPTVLAAVGLKGNWLRVLATELPNGRRGWIPASAATVTSSPWRIGADLSRRLVTVYRDGAVARRFRVAVGKPSTPTPTGHFAITDKLDFIGGSVAYGCCAVALTGHQTHLEPGWSGGTRLAIHGTSRPDTIGHAASFGCLRASDADVRWLVHRTYLGSIVEIRR